MQPMVYHMPHSESIGASLARALGAEVGALTLRRFPDGESYLRLDTSPKGRDVVVVASLDHPDDKVVPLMLLLETARELGARSVGLCAPYLCYMRQDKRFVEGEAISARVFPRLLERSLDWLVTVDPHLHRIADLDEVYSIPTRTTHASSAIAEWVSDHVDRPLLVGPDEESEQWVRSVAEAAGAPYLVLDKIRLGDRHVRVAVPDLTTWSAHTPVLVDDIISTGRTLVTTVTHLRQAGLRPAVCIGVHGLFADRAMEELRQAGVSDVVTCDSLVHPTNRIALAPVLATAIQELLRTFRDGSGSAS